MKKSDKIALRVINGFARFGVTEIRAGNLIIKKKGKSAVVEKVPKGKRRKV